MTQKEHFLIEAGLGNYSRNMLQLLTRHYPEHDYYLYTPSSKDTIDFVLPDEANAIIRTPEGWLDRKLKSLWRSLWMAKDLQRDDIELFHGLSNQLPKNIGKYQVRSVVTIHDLIFLRYPELYKKADRMIDTRKFRHAAETADRVIAVSKQTKADLVSFFDIPDQKIDVVYQDCHTVFSQTVSNETKQQIRAKYNLPQDFILSVGTIEVRKNIGIVVQALQKANIDMPLVIVGKPTPYLDTVKSYIINDAQKSKVIFLHEVPLADLPGLYQMAQLFVYPSIFEGFGIPVIEALHSDTPVITSKGGCFSESGGDAAYYIDPQSVDSVVQGIQTVLGSTTLQQEMIAKGQQHRLNFASDKLAHDLMQVYTKILDI